MSVYGLSRTVVPHLLQANSRLTPGGPTSSYCLWPPRSPGHSLLFVNYDHRSSIRKPVCVVLVLNTCGESRSSAFGVGRSRSQKMFFGMHGFCRTASLRTTSNRTTSRRTTSARKTSRLELIERSFLENRFSQTARLGEQLLREQLLTNGSHELRRRT